jgi:colanic acid/amylovoran biosynthesis glycosyltransferase
VEVSSDRLSPHAVLEDAEAPDRSVPAKRLKVAYLVSRFPHVSETFIVRELDAVAETPGLELEVLALFPPADPTVHPRAEPWLERLRRPSAGEAASAVVWWACRRPARLIASLALVVAGYARRPSLLGRALATVPLAAAHARGVRLRGVDHLHAHYATYPLLAAWLCRRLTGVPYSVTVHAHDIFVDRSFLERRLCDAEFVVAISEYNREFLLAHRSSGSTPIHVVHCGVDPAAYSFRARPLPEARPLRALCVASLQEYKGHQVLLRALAGAGDRLGRLELDLVGDGPLRAELEQLARDLGLSPRVHFHGSLAEPAVIDLLEAADLFVLPSVVARNGQQEGLPVVLMEALAVGAPAVASRLSGVPELIRDGSTGLLAEPGDPDDLARSIEAVPDDPAAARARAEAGRRLVEQEFDIRRSAATLARLFLGTPRNVSRGSAGRAARQHSRRSAG